MKLITEYFKVAQPAVVALLMVVGLGAAGASAQASESGAGSPRDSRCETRDTCTNLIAPTVDAPVESAAPGTHLKS